MKAAVIALTRNGSETALEIGIKLDAHVFIKEEFKDGSMTENCGIYPINTSLASLIGDIFNKYEALIFVMACGIVVRTIAPLIRSKTTDPAVIVMDEKGQNVISLLSGHLGGANKLTHRVAGITGGNAVITTSTDVNEMVSFDVFAAENDCVIENVDCLKYISAKLVNGGKVVLYSDYEIKGKVPDNIIVKQYKKTNGIENYECVVELTNQDRVVKHGQKSLVLRPRNLVLGIGCRRDTAKEQIINAVEDFMAVNDKSMLSLRCIATVDLKKDEKGLLEFCEEFGLELKIISRNEIVGIEENFTCSDFVKQKVGVASVAEPCAILASDAGRLICNKTKYSGITLALAEEKREFVI